MDTVLNVLLSFSDDEYWVEGREEPLQVPPVIIEINKWLSLNGGQLTDLTIASGGVGINANLFGGGFVNLDVASFTQLVVQQHWREASHVQLFTKSEMSDMWEMADLSVDEREPGDRG